MTTTIDRAALLSDDMLQRFDERAPVYDRENRFFTEDWDELRASGYLATPLPADLGGAGLTLAEVNRLQRRLAYHAPATALAVNMHLYWVGLAADLRRMGAPGGDWILAKAAAGEVLAAGHGEAGNDIPVLMSSATADRVDGGWEITAHKIFGSLSPVWTYLGVHAMDMADPSSPKVVHGFLDRRAPRYHIEETWDVLGMRATASQDTVLDRAFIPDDDVVMVCAPGFGGAGPFHVALFAWALL
ncbi:MAG TPA: acyl-CoA dehydrogenase family protein, partial [Acidimicrobiales bacterium]